MSAAAADGAPPSCSCLLLEGRGLSGVEVERTLEGWKMEGAVMGMFMRRFIAWPSVDADATLPDPAPRPLGLLSRFSSFTL